MGKRGVYANKGVHQVRFDLLSYPSPHLGGHRGVGRGAVTQPPRAAVLLPDFVVVVVVAVVAPFTVRKVRATKLGHVRREEDVLWRESVSRKTESKPPLQIQDSKPQSAKIRSPHL